MNPNIKNALGIAAGISLIALIVYGKWKLLMTPAVGGLIILSAIVFVVSTPAKAE